MTVIVGLNCTIFALTEKCKLSACKTVNVKVNLGEKVYFVSVMNTFRDLMNSFMDMIFAFRDLMDVFIELASTFRYLLEQLKYPQGT